jgi:hypothetical protein
MLVKIENGAPAQWPVTEAHVQATNPNTSFAMPIDEATLAQFGYATLHFSDPATYDAEWQEAVEIPPEQVDGKWTQQWDIIEKYTAEERAAKEAEKAAREAEFAATQYQRQRAAAYPSLAEQMDMQYWDAVNDTTKWQDAIAAVKAKYPKP